MSSDKQRKVSKLAKWDPCLKERKTELPPVSLKIAARKATSIKGLLQIRFKNWPFRIRKKLLQGVTVTSLTIFTFTFAEIRIFDCFIRYSVRDGL